MALRLALLPPLLLSGATAVFAQQPVQPPLARVDVAGSVGHLSARMVDWNDSGRSWHQGAFLSLTAGLYWSEHHKTELDVGTGTSGDEYAARRLPGPAGPVYQSARLEFRTWRVGVTQLYQFGRNAWFHPHVGAGVDVVRETSSGLSDPAYGYAPYPNPPAVVYPGQVIGPDTRVRIRLATEAGFKWYVSERAFFRSDLRLTVRSTVEGVLLRAGFGVDF